MQWEVTGVDRESGVETTILIDADTEESAIRRGNRRGLMVSSAVVVSDSASAEDWIPEPTVEMAEEPVTVDETSAYDAPTEPEPVYEESDPAQSEAVSIDYASPQRSMSVGGRTMPPYPDITAGATVLRSLATVVLILGLIVAGLTVLFGVVGLLAGLSRNNSGAGLLAAIPLFIFAALYALGAYVTSVLLRLIAACSLALRDIARNSFRS